MNFGLDLNLHVGLEQKLSPQMIQSLKLLQMNSMELELMVKQELESNPLLEATDEPDDVEGPQEERDEATGTAEERAEDRAKAEEAAEGAKAEGEEAPPEPPDLNDLDKLIPDDPKETKEVDWESYLEDGFDLGSKQTEELDSPDERFEKVPVYSKSLQDHLLAQLHDRTVRPEVAILVEYLINSLDDRGYLVTEAEAAAAVGEAGETGGEGVEDEEEEAVPARSPSRSTSTSTAPAPSAPRPLAKPMETHPGYKEIQGVIDGSLSLAEAGHEVREAFHVLQGMEPAGIGARNLRECLLLQIYRLGRVSPMARRIVEEEFDLLEKLKVAAIAKKFDVPPEQVQAAMKEIGALQPHPGRLVSASVANPIMPDLIVEEVEGELVLMLNDRSIPSLKVSRAYTEMLKKGSRASNEEKKFVRDKLNSATWLIRAIEQRKSTMLKVMQAIIESQPDFFKQGPTHLRPLILQDVADKIGMHISTVSRVTNGKYVQTSHGIFELKYFFTAGVTQSDGREVSSVTTKDEIKKLIEGEDPKKPLSDQKIVELLKSKGLDVARRTVAKYRDQLEILPARLRRQY
ncbi:MAG TPA: RNA polymerase factor sigma-54 [Fibrobacteria bacterium]|nr:RNA polymerase factor sigma-54 [Fibrobacteria bacterium]